MTFNDQNLGYMCLQVMKCENQAHEYLLSLASLEEDRSNDGVDLAEVMLTVPGKENSTCTKQGAVSSQRVGKWGLSH